MADSLDHLKIVGFTDASPFQSTLSVRPSPPPNRNRSQHGNKLLREINHLKAREEMLSHARAQAGLPTDAGMAIVLEIPASAAHDIQKIEWKRDGIEILNIRTDGDKAIVVVHVPDGSLSAFEKRIREYLTEETKKNKPKHAALINTIDRFRAAAFTELWTDDESPPQDETEEKWFQLWLRANKNPYETHRQFAELARQFEIGVEEIFTLFPERVVIAAHGQRANLEKAVTLLDYVAEIRYTATTSEFFLSDLTPAEQVDWVNDLLQRTDAAPIESNAPVVALFDTGVNYGHPLIQPSLDQHDLHAVDTSWLGTDHHGHGTQMAGLILHGDLNSPLASTNSHSVPHRLESVKILPPQGQNHPHLYGAIVRTAVEQVENTGPNRNRSLAMMTTAEPSIHGFPTEWSAAIDQLAAGASNHAPDPAEGVEKPRLFILSAGNVEWNEWDQYPFINVASQIQDPAQAWNAITVGAHTELTSIDATKWPALVPIAKPGDLSPSATTSVMWTRSPWPIKPDVVAEGGNGSTDRYGPTAGPESLRLLTTSKDITTALLTESGDTSAAAAEVARLGAHIAARYPNYWPETLRALIIHGARYTSEMRTGLPLTPTRNQKEYLVRRFGFGAVNYANSLASTNRKPVLIIEDTLKPYRRDGSDIKLNEHHLHSLPWPAEQLREYGEADVELRITLSYFVVPNPSRRGWQSKFRYQSHGLRFAVRGSTETPEIFAKRINKLEREEDDPSLSDPDRDGWLLGHQLRSRGSIHSDAWSGSAAALADKSAIAVFPVGGWWKDWKGGNGHDQTIRYSLVVSLEIADTVDVDLYTPIQTALQVPVLVEGS